MKKTIGVLVLIVALIGVMPVFSQPERSCEQTDSQECLRVSWSLEAATPVDSFSSPQVRLIPLFIYGGFRVTRESSPVAASFLAGSFTGSRLEIRDPDSLFPGMFMQLGGLITLYEECWGCCCNPWNLDVDPVLGYGLMWPPQSSFNLKLGWNLDLSWDSPFYHGVYLDFGWNFG